MKKYSHETLVGIFVVIGLICVGYMTVKLGNVSLLDDDSFTINARFNSVSGLRIGNPVEMFGIEIGRVVDFKIDQTDQVAMVKMKVKKDIKVYNDAIASIKTAGLIGDRYVRIDPGGSGRLLKSGDIITNTESPIDIGEMIGKYAFGEVKK